MSHPPYSSYDFNKIQSQDFNPFDNGYAQADYDNLEKGKQFPVGGIENVADEGLPLLGDVNQIVTDYWKRFGAQPCSVQFQATYGNLINHDQTQYAAPESGEQVKEKAKAASQNLTSVSSLELLSSYWSKFKGPEESITKRNETVDCGKKLSTEQILKLAAEKFINFSTQKVSGYTMFTHPYETSAFMGLSVDDIREVELVFQIFSAAEKIGRKQFDAASKLLKHCERVASSSGSPVERLVFYVAEALRKRIDKETGNDIPRRLEKLGLKNETQLALGWDPSFLACYQHLPFCQVMQLAGTQAIIDKVKTWKKVHLIDLHVRIGVQWPALMQAMAEQKPQVQLLKITALATPSDVKETEETGKRLESFAESLGLPFSFKTLVLSDITGVQEEQFEVQADEAVAVHCHLILRTMISRPKCLEHLMRSIRKIKPLIVVVTEIEANHTSTSFVNRFTDMLFFHSAFFDCLGDCMEPDNIHRAKLESVYSAQAIQNMVATEGDERISRNVKLGTWRLFFARFGMVEMELSESCLYQANLVLEQFSQGSSCTLENDGKSLIVGWKGTPFHSLSTWKFI